jgi:hypothetical protein
MVPYFIKSSLSATRIADFKDFARKNHVIARALVPVAISQGFRSL